MSEIIKGRDKGNKLKAAKHRRSPKPNAESFRGSALTLFEAQAQKASVDNSVVPSPIAMV
jgi:hypothetical protein